MQNETKRAFMTNLVRKKPPPSCGLDAKPIQSIVQSDSSKEGDRKHAIAVGKRGGRKGTAVQAP